MVTKKTFFISYILSPVEWLVSYFFVMVLFAGCDQVCVEPLTASPFGSPCGCVFPMKVRLLLDIAPYSIFPVMSELEIEVAEGTYLAQSQVIIMGASADSQNQGRTVVDINLVPLGEKFDNTTAILTYDRFKHKKVPLNLTLFGNYEVLYISYPGTNPNSHMFWLIISVCIVVETETVIIRDTFFTTIFEGEWTNRKSSKPPYHCRVSQKEPENEYKNHCHYCPLCLCTPIGYSWSNLGVHKMEESWKTI